MTLNETHLDMALEIYNSCLSRRNYPQYHKDETYLSAKECLALGLVDKII